MERSFALSAGIGFIDKNNTLIIPGHGSCLYLAEILTTAILDFPEAEPMETQYGSCTLCIEACPTGALSGPFDLNAQKSLSYLTIEYKGPLPRKSGGKMGRCFFGDEFKDRFGKTSPARAGLEKLKDNLRAVTDSDNRIRYSLKLMVSGAVHKEEHLDPALTL